MSARESKKSKRAYEYHYAIQIAQNDATVTGVNMGKSKYPHPVGI